MANLTAENTYTGDTRVEQGTLRIDHPYLADASDVYVATGGLFNLNFSGIDTIDGLYLDNVLQAAGTYGAAGTGTTLKAVSSREPACCGACPNQARSLCWPWASWGCWPMPGGGRSKQAADFELGSQSNCDPNSRKRLWQDCS